jgi:sugar/nucleoside kinase (ribokinase family)
MLETKNPNSVLLLGGIILDRYFEVYRYPEAGQDTLIQRSYDRVGGCCLNVAVTLNNLGTQPFIVDQFGDDETGIKIEKYIQSLHLPTACMLKAPGKQTGYCLTILDKSGERTFFTFKGCEEEFLPEGFPGKLNSGFALAYITGYYLINQQTASKVIDLAQRLIQNGCQVVFDPGALIGEMDAGQLRAVLSASDWLIPNLHEMMIIEHKLAIRENLVDWFLTLGKRGVLVKKGSQGVEVHTPETTMKLNSYSVHTRDTSGAGDSFAGGFIHGLANGYSLKASVELANICGAFTATVEGPHGFFSLQDINKFRASLEEDNS